MYVCMHVCICMCSLSFTHTIENVSQIILKSTYYVVVIINKAVIYYCEKAPQSALILWSYVIRSVLTLLCNCPLCDHSIPGNPSEDIQRANSQTNNMDNLQLLKSSFCISSNIHRNISVHVSGKWTSETTRLIREAMHLSYRVSKGATVLLKTIWAFAAVLPRANCRFICSLTEVKPHLPQQKATVSARLISVTVTQGRSEGFNRLWFALFQKMALNVAHRDS